MKTMNASDIQTVSGGYEGSPWYGPFEVYRPGQPIHPHTPWAPPVPNQQP